ncbi:hypothetical protein V5T82_05105 [Magnetovibrio sp. PR-2]|uniref:hypothetical protein n=1 Tax=Magnetovibrio sp. PR-2 TaxID=3120356 RepID=UPI002FCDF02D
MLTFEVVLYNEAVRARVREGLHHRQLSDDWGDSHYVEIKAADETRALAKVEERYPSDHGYVVEGITLM